MMTTAKAAERHLFVVLHSQPVHRQRVRALLLELVDLVRAEPGCLYYHLFEHANDPATFQLLAAWADDAAQAAHPTPPQARLVEQLLPLLSEPMQVVPTRRVSENPE